MYHHEPWLEEYQLQGEHYFHFQDPIPACHDQQAQGVHISVPMGHVYITGRVVIQRSLMPEFWAKCKSH